MKSIASRGAPGEGEERGERERRERGEERGAVDV
jgi:hypothetical protein